ncbi:hypothetical protein BH10ACI2_BH10ACI2_01950 [soil metagenome]
MKKVLLAAALTIFATLSAFAQTPKPADPKDVATRDSIVKAVYDVISGDMGKARDWDRFRSLFHPDARLIPTNKNVETGLFSSKALSPDEYVKRVEPVFAKQGFFETELARHTDQYGSIVQIFSTYESRRTPKDPMPFARGVNSFQLLNDGKRWWIVTIYWLGETPDFPLPPELLKNRN